MTAFTTNTLADLNSRGRRMVRAQEANDAAVWRLIDGLPALLFRRTDDPVRTLEKAARREAARRTVDGLLR